MAVPLAHEVRAEPRTAVQGATRKFQIWRYWAPRDREAKLDRGTENDDALCALGGTCWYFWQAEFVAVPAVVTVQILGSWES